MSVVEREWDYTDLATSYLKRPAYSPQVLERLRILIELEGGDRVCDMGAGTGNLTLPMLEWGQAVVAIEPNAAMRNLGMKRTSTYQNITWRDATAESSGEPAGSFALVAFGSSFNVVNRARALQEASHILQNSGWLACLWNHRDLSDPLQFAIEAVIQRNIPGYSYGVRRQDQTGVIQSSGLFGAVSLVEGATTHPISQADFMEAWWSHATLRNQAKDRFESVLGQIKEVISRYTSGDLAVPYTTRMWVARKQRCSAG